MDFARLRSAAGALLVSLALTSCDDQPSQPSDSIAPLFPLAVGNSWHYEYGYSDTVYADTTINGHTWYITKPFAFPAIQGRFLIRVDENERYWGRFNNEEAVVLDPAWPIQETHALDFGTAPPDSGEFTVTIHTKHLTQVVLGDTIQNCFVVEFNDRLANDGWITVVMARGIGTVRRETYFSLLRLVAYKLNEEE